MSNFYLVCPNCGWRDINSEFDKYSLDPLGGPKSKTTFGSMHFKGRCTHCGWIGSLQFDLTIETERKGGSLQ